MSTIGGVLLDLDGTLADTLGDIAAAMNHVLAAHGLPQHQAPQYKLLIGEGVEMLSRRAVPADRESLIPEIVTAFRAHYADHLLETTRPYDGIPEMLDALDAAGLPLAILSNKPDAPTRRIVEALFPRVPFRAVLGYRGDFPRKPDPASALHLATQLGVPPTQVAFVGDTSVDMETARAAGMHALGVLWGFRDRDELLAHGAAALAAHPSEVPTLLAGLGR